MCIASARNPCESCELDFHFFSKGHPAPVGFSSKRGPPPFLSLRKSCCISRFKTTTQFGSGATTICSGGFLCEVLCCFWLGLCFWNQERLRYQQEEAATSGGNFSLGPPAIGAVSFSVSFLVGRFGSPSKIDKPEKEMVPTYSNLSNLEDLANLRHELCVWSCLAWAPAGSCGTMSFSKPPEVWTYLSGRS